MTIHRVCPTTRRQWADFLVALMPLLHRQYKTARTETRWHLLLKIRQMPIQTSASRGYVLFISGNKRHTKVLKLSAGLRTHPAECSKLGKTQIIADAKRGVVRNAGFCGQIYRRLLHLELIPASAPIINLLPLCQPFLCQFFFPSVTESVCSSYCPLEDLWMVTSTVVPAL